MYPGNAPDRTNPLLYIIVLICFINLGLTGALWLHINRNAPLDARGNESEILPSYLDATMISNLADDVARLYNSHNTDALYAKFDDLAKVEVSREQLKKQLIQFTELIGNIESSVYTRFETGSYEGFDVYNLHYKVKLANGPFETGRLRISVIDRGTSAGLIGFNINGESK